MWGCGSCWIVLARKQAVFAGKVQGAIGPDFEPDSIAYYKRYQGQTASSHVGPAQRVASLAFILEGRKEKTSVGEAWQGQLKEFGGRENSRLPEPERREGGTGGKQTLNVKRSLMRPDPCVPGAQGHLSLSPEAGEDRRVGVQACGPGKATGQSQRNRCPLSACLHLTVRPLWAGHSEASLKDI